MKRIYLFLIDFGSMPGTDMGARFLTNSMPSKKNIDFTANS